MSCSFRKSRMRNHVLCKLKLIILLCTDIITDKSSSICQSISLFAVKVFVCLAFNWLSQMYVYDVMALTYIFRNPCTGPFMINVFYEWFYEWLRGAGGVYCWFSSAISWVLVVNSLFTFTSHIHIVLSIKTWTLIYVYRFFFFSFQWSPLFMFKGCGALLYNQW